jgi:hypothetical protein
VRFDALTLEEDSLWSAAALRPVRDPPAASESGHISAGFNRLVDGRLQIGAWPEPRHAPRGELHVSSVSGIAHAPRLSFAHCEGSESRDGHAVASLQAGLNSSDTGFQGARSLSPGEVGFDGDPAYQFFLSHNARE